MSVIGENLNNVRSRIESAAVKSGRGAGDITLVAVTKTRSVDEIKEAAACGVTDIGENYIQEAEIKYGEVGDIARWHFIGHLQSNKVRRAVEFCSLIHSVDSIELAREIGRRADSAGRIIEILIEVKVSGEDTKFGVDSGDVLALADQMSNISGIRVCGLMGMAPFLANPEETRPCFAKLRELWDKLPDEQRLFLSMGMTQDFAVAVEEGSNMVRIGTAIFGPRG